MGMERNRGFLIAGSAVPRFAAGFDWDSQDIVFRSGGPGSTVEIKHIKGPIVNSKDAAEEHGLKLCKDWIDNRLDRPQNAALWHPPRFTAMLTEIRSRWNN